MQEMTSVLFKNSLMERCKIIALSFALVSLCVFSYGQNKTPYGSNNGKYISISNKKIYYEEYGKGTPLLLLEGGLKTISDFSLCIPELSKHFHVIAPDDPGQGRSQMLDTMDYEMLAAYVSQLIDKLKLDSVYVMGWSDGGIAALILAENRPDKVKKVIAVGANYTHSGYVSSSPENDTVQLIPLDYQPPPDDQKWIDNYFIANKQDWRKIINDRKIMWAKDTCIPKEILLQIKIPVMIVLGDRDIVKPEQGIEMHRLIKGSQLCILPNTSHDVFSEKPDLIKKISLDFFIK